MSPSSSPLALTRLLLFILALTIPIISANPLPEPDQALEVPSTAIPATSAAPTFNLAERGVIVKRSFLGSCLPPFTLQSGRYLTASCRKSDGSWAITPPLDLNKCIANVDGFLKWGLGGNFKNSCPSVNLRVDWGVESIDAVVLVANCQRANGGIRGTELSLDDRLHNYNGVLACGV